METTTGPRMKSRLQELQKPRAFGSTFAFTERIYMQKDVKLAPELEYTMKT